jgi:hypothetical protein
MNAYMTDLKLYTSYRQECGFVTDAVEEDESEERTGDAEQREGRWAHAIERIRKEATARAVEEAQTALVEGVDGVGAGEGEDPPGNNGKGKKAKKETRTAAPAPASPSTTSTTASTTGSAPAAKTYLREGANVHITPPRSSTATPAMRDMSIPSLTPAERKTYEQNQATIQTLGPMFYWEGPWKPDGASDLFDWQNNANFYSHSNGYTGTPATPTLEQTDPQAAQLLNKRYMEYGPHVAANWRAYRQALNENRLLNPQAAQRFFVKEREKFYQARAAYESTQQDKRNRFDNPRRIVDVQIENDVGSGWDVAALKLGTVALALSPVTRGATGIRGMAAQNRQVGAAIRKAELIDKRSKATEQTQAGAAEEASRSAKAREHRARDRQDKPSQPNPIKPSQAGANPPKPYTGKDWDPRPTATKVEKLIAQSQAKQARAARKDSDDTDPADHPAHPGRGGGVSTMRSPPGTATLPKGSARTTDTPRSPTPGAAQSAKHSPTQPSSKSSPTERTAVKPTKPQSSQSTAPVNVLMPKAAGTGWSMVTMNPQDVAKVPGASLAVHVLMAQEDGSYRYEAHSVENLPKLAQHMPDTERARLQGQIEAASQGDYVGYPTPTPALRADGTVTVMIKLDETGRYAPTQMKPADILRIQTQLPPTEQERLSPVIEAERQRQAAQTAQTAKTANTDQAAEKEATTTKASATERSAANPAPGAQAQSAGQQSHETSQAPALPAVPEHLKETHKYVIPAHSLPPAFVEHMEKNGIKDLQKAVLVPLDDWDRFVKMCEGGTLAELLKSYHALIAPEQAGGTTELPRMEDNHTNSPEVPDTADKSPQKVEGSASNAISQLIEELPQQTARWLNIICADSSLELIDKARGEMKLHVNRLLAMEHSMSQTECMQYRDTLNKSQALEVMQMLELKYKFRKVNLMRMKFDFDKSNFLDSFWNDFDHLTDEISTHGNRYISRVDKFFKENKMNVEKLSSVYEEILHKPEVLLSKIKSSLESLKAKERTISEDEFSKKQAEIYLNMLQKEGDVVEIDKGFKLKTIAYLTTMAYQRNKLGATGVEFEFSSASHADHPSFSKR